MDDPSDSSGWQKSIFERLRPRHYGTKDEPEFIERLRKMRRAQLEYLLARDLRRLWAARDRFPEAVSDPSHMQHVLSIAPLESDRVRSKSAIRYG